MSLSTRKNYKSYKEMNIYFTDVNQIDLSLIIIPLIKNNLGICVSFKDHLQTSHQNPSCEFCDKRFESSNELEFHKLNECNKVTELCPLKNYGCLMKVSDKEQIR